MKTEKNFTMKKGQNGLNYVDYREITEAKPHIVKNGNSKTGPEVGCYNLPVEHSCNHNCKCYKSKACYACGGFYQMPDNQYGYAENLAYFLKTDSKTFCDVFCDTLRKNKNKKFRYFTIGDILNSRFFECMIENARRMPEVKFWSYTKKYDIVNKWVDAHGMEAWPKNLTIIFSHWLNDDGSYFPMDNKYNFPTSEFIPYGMEELAKTVTHICPCSNPEVLATCNNCEHPCYELKHGESMGLMEHSTARTKKRDKAVKEAHKRLANK